MDDDVGDPENLLLVGTPETITARLVAVGPHIGPDEVVYRVPRWLIPEVQ